MAKLSTFTLTLISALTVSLILVGVVAAAVILNSRVNPVVGDEPSSRIANGAEQSNPTSPAASMRLYTVQDAEGRGAICNDGTPAKFYFQAGTTENSDKWVIYFKGGGGCGDEATCLTRAQEDEPGLMSSRPYPNTSREDGILSTNPETNADFYNWNHVKLMYCSSDSWAGTTEQIIGGETWNFHGKAIVEAMFADLQNPEVIRTANLGSASQVLITGSSAGGGGVSNNLDDIASWLPGVQVKGFIDSSWSYDNPVFEVIEGTENRNRTGYTDYRGTVLDSTCVEAHADDPSLCTLLSYNYPYLETPTFIFQNQYDQLKMANLGLTIPFDATEQAFLDTTFIPGLLESYTVVDDGLFSPKQTFHTMLTSSRYTSTKLDGVSIQEAFTNWYFGRPGPTRLVEE